MVPMTMRLDVRNQDRKGVRLFFPVILLWIIAFALLIAILPLVLVAALVTLRWGPGTRLLLFYPVFFGTVFAMSGLRVDIASHGSKTVFISFD
jgi:cellulose synthase/poly-beta-1,6-N-acetylglucosamine synthase-like glycosyltransferase